MPARTRSIIKVAFEFGDGADDDHQGAAQRSSCIDLLSERDELDVEPVEFICAHSAPCSLLRGCCGRALATRASAGAGACKQCACLPNRLRKNSVGCLVELSPSEGP
jgi:hypothetical protein